MEQDYIKIIFGLKVRQLRTDRDLSLYGLSKLTGLSKSYLNEIEKGKKYPKPDKINLLSEHLDVSYDELVSLKLNKNLAPIGDILQSRLLKDIPLELFGVQEGTLIEIIANAPAKVTAFISTIIEIARHYNFSKESFYLAAVRSFQEANLNYFDDLEKEVIQFSKKYQIPLTRSINSQELEDLLTEEFGYTINNEELKAHTELDNLRSVFIPETKTLLMSSLLDEAQRCFIYAKEIAYNYLELKERLYTFSWIAFESFDEVLNNFYASYFAGALVLPRQEFTKDLKDIFESKTFEKASFDQLIKSFNASPESFYQRLTNILPKDFKLKQLFFLRFAHLKGSSDYHLNKELHLSRQHSPHGNETDEHYCRRWISLKVLDRIQNNGSKHEFDIQISHYPNDERSYLVMASATQDPFKPHFYRSVSVGIPIDNNLKRRINFLKDSKISTETVGVTCERCPIDNCSVRQVAPHILKKQQKDKRIAKVVSGLQEKFSRKN
jgi:predicted transcriptional regulator